MSSSKSETQDIRTLERDPRDLDIITVPCEMSECIDTSHTYVRYDPGAVDFHRALRIDRTGADRNFPANYWLEVFLGSDGRWKLDLYATECYTDGDETTTLLADLQKASDLAAELNAKVNA